MIHINLLREEQPEGLACPNAVGHPGAIGPSSVSESELRMEHGIQEPPEDYGSTSKNTNS